MKGKSEEVKTINNNLASIKSNLYKHYHCLLALEKPISAEILKNSYLGIGQKQKTLQDVFSFNINRFTEKVKNGKKEKVSLKSLRITHQKINDFISHQYHRSDMFLNEIKR